MTFKQYRDYFLDTVGRIYDRMEAESFFYLILASKFSVKRTDIALNQDMPIPEYGETFLNDCILQLENSVPIQYILGETYFFGRRFVVSPAVLIPRPETEELLEWIIKDTTVHGEYHRILDIGTGSGCIAVTLASELDGAIVTAMDISEDALAIAGENAALNNCRVDFIRADILAGPQSGSIFDLIISNPPYVRQLEKHEIHPNVLEYEPHLALFVADEDPLLFYRAICTYAKTHLRKGGKLYFEINQYLATPMWQLLLREGFDDIELRKDIYGNDRMMKAVYS